MAGIVILRGIAIGITALFLTQGYARDLDKIYPKKKFKVGGQAIEAYVADSEEKRADGLMYVTRLPENTGMLFVFEREQPLTFWMKNTLIPLAIGFFDDGGKLVDIQEMEPVKSMVIANFPTYQSRKPARFALEMNKSWFSRRKVVVGERLSPVPSRH